MIRRLDRKDLVTWLLGKDYVSLPEVAAHFDVAPATAQHHLDVLSESNIVLVKEGKGHKGYGAKYKLDQSELTDFKTLAVAIITLTLFSIGAAYFYKDMTSEACVFLLPSALLGIIYVWIHYSTLYQNRVERLLRDLNSS